MWQRWRLLGRTRQRDNLLALSSIQAYARTIRLTFMPSTYPSEVQRFIDHQLASGHFSSEKDVILAGLQVLAELSDRHTDLKQQIARSVAQGERGQLREVDFADLKVRVADRARESHQS